MFTETNPDKGTETLSILLTVSTTTSLFTETNPDKGTETLPYSRKDYLLLILEFTETNPDKGKETFIPFMSPLTIPDGLQKLTPIRGRKLVKVNTKARQDMMFTETNPDKGTETPSNLFSTKFLNIKFTETNPDKGTETFDNNIPKVRDFTFTETNPDKGTETVSVLKFPNPILSGLQKLTPIRGRKLYSFEPSMYATLFVYRN